MPQDGKDRLNVLNKCNSKLGILRKIRKKFNVDQFLKIVKRSIMPIFTTVLRCGCMTQYPQGWEI